MTLAAAIQMCSVPEPEANLAMAARLLQQAAQAGAKLAVLPENFAHMGLHPRDKLALAEAPGQGPLQAFLSEQAARHGLWLVGGTIPMRPARNPRPARIYAASLLFDPDGKQQARYDKLHLFDVNVSPAESYRESASFRPGRQVVGCDTPLGRIGLSVCYDLRFPELYRRLVRDGAHILSVPSAFTHATGQAHWEVLLRARAVENLAWVIAPGQCGTHANGRRTWGHSMIVSPWGELRAVCQEGPGLALADMDMAELATLRTRFPALEHRRLP